MSEKAVRQYLQRYTEPETSLLDSWPGRYHYKHCVLIPAYQEATAFLHRLLTAPWFRADVLLILVINQPETAPDTTPQQRLHHFATQSGQCVWQTQNLQLIQATGNTGHILLVDRFRQPVPVRQGVGLARKIAADLALALMDRGAIQSDWICSTDADAILPHNYFSALKTITASHVAACYPFEHVPAPDAAPEVTAATLIYQQALRYYVAGLTFAGSPYAHFTIGSILAVKAGAYAQVRGFPKRAAGEDFYLLNKLVKTGSIAQVPEATIELQARLSDRVPFGTGVSTAKIVQLTQQQEEFHYYHPQTFVALREVLQHFDKLWFAKDTPQDWLRELPPPSAEALVESGILDITAKQRQQCRNKPQFDHQLRNWFDGLKTLQFIHQLRDSTYPNLPLSQAINEATFSKNLSGNNAGNRPSKLSAS